MKVNRTQVAALVAGVIVLGAAGCGSTDSAGTTKVSSPTGASGLGGTQVSHQQARPRPQQAASVVRHFYGLLNGHQYTEAWGLVPPSVRAQAGGYEQWKAGYSATVSSQPRNLVVESGVGRNTVVVGLDLNATDIDACSGAKVSQVFSGTWRLQATPSGGWEPQAISFHKISGATPNLSASDCSSSGSGGTSPQPGKQSTTVSNCDPSYSGKCLKPDSPDYDCAGGTGDGPDYVQGPMQVAGDDPYDLDSDGDGVACE